MDKERVKKQIGVLKAHIAAMEHTLTVLEQELQDSGASGSSARKGKKEATQKKIDRVLAKRKADKMRKSQNRD